MLECVGYTLSDVILARTLDKTDFLKIIGIENGLQGGGPEVRKAVRRQGQEAGVGCGGISGLWKPGTEVLWRVRQC